MKHIYPSILIILFGCWYSGSLFAAESLDQVAWAYVMGGQVTQWLPDDEHPNAQIDASKAICQGNQVYQVTKIDKSFKLEKGAASVTGDCLLVPESFLRSNKLVQLAQLSEECSPMLSKAIQSNRRIGVEHCWIRANVDKSDELGLVVFKSTGAIGTSGKPTKVASIFFRDPENHFFYQDFPSSGIEDESWRVGDGGLLNWQDFNFFAAFRTKEHRIGLAYSWGGGEGVNGYVVLGDKNQLEPVFHSYLYTEGH